MNNWHQINQWTSTIRHEFSLFMRTAKIPLQCRLRPHLRYIVICHHSYFLTSKKPNCSTTSIREMGRYYPIEVHDLNYEYAYWRQLMNICTVGQGFPQLTELLPVDLATCQLLSNIMGKYSFTSVVRTHQSSAAIWTSGLLCLRNASHSRALLSASALCHSFYNK